MGNLAQEMTEHHSPGNRFSYYPPVSRWQKGTLKEEALPTLSETLSLYLHLPFCQNLCTFCGCNIKVSGHEEEHLNYVEALLKELSLYVKLWDRPLPPINTLTFGGGSPNFLHPKAWDKLQVGLLPHLSHPASSDGLAELDPRLLTKEQVDRFCDLGVKRFSFGVQDFHQEIVENVNRHRDPQDLVKAGEILKDHSFGIDLIWGLPLQTPQSIKEWIQPLKDLAPDWISYYPLARVPWLESIQEAYGDFNVPVKHEKYLLYESGHEVFGELGYELAGFGQYLKKGSLLHKSFLNKDLYHTVSGLYPKAQNSTLGLGVSAISDFPTTLWQNEKIFDRYLHQTLGQKILPVALVHEKTQDEKLMETLIDKVKRTNKMDSAYFENFPEHWLEGTNATNLSPYGRHFKKNVLQVLEKNLNERLTFKT